MGIRSDRSPVYGWGINDYPDSISTKGVKMKEYVAWTNMIKRCVCCRNLSGIVEIY